MGTHVSYTRHHSASITILERSTVLARAGRETLQFGTTCANVGAYLDTVDDAFLTQKMVHQKKMLHFLNLPD